MRPAQETVPARFFYGLTSARPVSKVTSRLARSAPVMLSARPARIIGQLSVTGRPKQVVIDAGHALVACMDGALDVVELSGPVRTASVPVPGMPVDVLVHGTAGIALVSSMQTRPDRRGRVCQVDLRRGELTAVADLMSGWAKGMSIRPATSELWVTTWLAGGIEVIDIDTMQTRARLALGVAPRGIAFDGDGDCFVTDYYGRMVLHIDAVRLAVRASYRMPYRGLAYKGTPRDVLISPGPSLTISNMGRGTVHRFTIDAVASPVRETTVTVGARPATLRYAPDGDIWCACHGPGELWRLASSDLRPLQRWRLPAPVYGMDVDGAGRVVAGLFDTATLIVAEMAAGTVTDGSRA
jgi:hypothetical protein